MKKNRVGNRSRIFLKILSVFTILAFCSLQSFALDLGTYKGCALSDADFIKTPIQGGGKGAQFDGSGSANAIKMAFVANVTGHADVYYIQKNGEIHRFNGGNSKDDNLGKIPKISEMDNTRDQGLIGIAIRKDFNKNPFLFITYSYGVSINGNNIPDLKIPSGLRISRIKLSSDLKTIDQASEKILIDITRSHFPRHTGGAMDFDDYGDLWVSIGDDETSETGPGNTADLRGSILRIHPDESALGYSIPKGNFGEYFSNYFKAAGKNSLAIQYSDTSKVKPEIYVKGCRNTYTLSLDPVKRWLVTGDVGPDGVKGNTEKYELLTKPAYLGWPYFSGEGNFCNTTPYEFPIPCGSTKELPINKNKNIKGVDTLPPIHEPAYAQGQSCAMTGPIFRYNGALDNPGQMPPQFNRKWMIKGCDWTGWWLFNLDSAGTSAHDSLQIWGAWGHQDNLIDLKQGPDGSLYYIEFGGWGAITRIDYKGSCKDPNLLPEVATTSIRNRDNISRSSWIKPSLHSITISTLGFHRIQFFTTSGKMLWEVVGYNPKTYQIPKLPSALVIVKAQSLVGNSEFNLSILGD